MYNAQQATALSLFLSRLNLQLVSNFLGVGAKNALKRLRKSEVETKRIRIRILHSRGKFRNHASKHGHRQAAERYAIGVMR